MDKKNNFNKSTIINTGNKSVNIGVGCENVNDIHVENINIVESPEDQDSVIHYSDHISYRLPINLKAIDYINKISMILGLISSVITILGVLLNVKYITQYLDKLVFIMIAFFYCSYLPLGYKK